MRTSLLFLPALLGFATFATAETVKDREGAVRSDRETMEKSDRWIYNDIAHGFAESAKNGKPVLVVREE